MEKKERKRYIPWASKEKPKEYRPRKGDIVLMDTYGTGHVQNGRRPTVIVSGNYFNRISKGLVQICPITTSDHIFMYRVGLDDRTKTSGSVLCDQIRIADLKDSNPVFLERLPEDLIQKVLESTKDIQSRD